MTDTDYRNPVPMRYRLYPTTAQEQVLREHCAHARFVWNLGQEQRLWWHPGRRSAPGFNEQNRQLTEARATECWLAKGSVNVQQQALRDLDQAWQRFYAGTHRKPDWRKAQRNEGFRIVGKKGQHWDVRRLSRHVGEVRVPKIGWVRFRWSRPVPEDVKSYRVNRDPTGRWHVAFASVPDPIPTPGIGEVVGIDRGVTVTLALSDGTKYQARTPRSVKRWQRRLARAKRGSKRREQIKARLVRLHTRNRDTRKDWVEKVSTEIARRYEVIRIEDLRVRNMTRSARGTVEQPGRNIRQKAGLNRAIHQAGWGAFARRLEDKARGRVEKVPPAFTSQRCSACGHVAAESRKSQALFACVACTFTLNADVNAARNIAAGHAVTARGGPPLGEPANREPTAG